MQNQPKLQFEIKIEEYPLPSDFPVHHFSYCPKSTDIHSLHTHDFLEIGLCVSGQGIFVVDEEIYPFSEGTLFVIFKNQLHKAQSTGDGSQWQFIYVNAEQLCSGLPAEDLLLLAPILSGKMKRCSLISPDIHPEIIQSVHSILNELRDQPSGYRSCVKSQLWTFLIQLDRAIPPLAERNARDIRKLAPALEYISKNYSRQITVLDIARHSYMSLTNLRREFSRILQMSPSDYLSSMRVQYAAALLRASTFPVTEVAFQTGFSSISTFNRSFKWFFGCSPKQYRKNLFQF